MLYLLALCKGFPQSSPVPPLLGCPASAPGSSPSLGAPTESRFPWGATVRAYPRVPLLHQLTQTAGFGPTPVTLKLIDISGSQRLLLHLPIIPWSQASSPLHHLCDVASHMGSRLSFLMGVSWDLWSLGNDAPPAYTQHFSISISLPSFKRNLRVTPKASR